MKKLIGPTKYSYLSITCIIICFLIGSLNVHAGNYEKGRWDNVWSKHGSYKHYQEYLKKKHKKQKDSGIFQVGIFGSVSSDSGAAGAATLVRTADKLTVNYAATGLDPYATYNAWWLIINAPEHCGSIPCLIPDVVNPDTRTASFWAEGFVTGGEGIHNGSVTIDSGSLPEGIDIVIDSGKNGEGLERGNGYTAQVLLILRTHGPTIPDQLHIQFSDEQHNAANEPPTEEGEHEEGEHEEGEEGHEDDHEDEELCDACYFQYGYFFPPIE